MNPSLRTNEKYLAVTQTKEFTRQYEARAMDVQKRDKEIAIWNKLPAETQASITKPEQSDGGRSYPGYGPNRHLSRYFGQRVLR